ncbi:hypothetical protein SADUNF_Sadunf16G0065100 [Salix dunnii]|uniref:cytokinin riboside 5'-monophosphate phosphoribohydrolase n=1 Tax=Salix dunnii TaxID=1413687 RepID=A0A835J8E4_9ROSI|nr:hypothetical protein SADUNF_Sadunf16G0065100 [Salix dunnii]
MEETKSKFKRICVFCGSSSGKKASYQEAAVELAKELVDRRIDLVYGGGSLGLMGLVSQAVHDEYYPLKVCGQLLFGSFLSSLVHELDKAICFGPRNVSVTLLCNNTVRKKVTEKGGRKVIPRSLMPREVTGEPVGEVRAVSDMHQRKAEMARQADAFIALPGGYGTLEELLEVITWAQLNIHQKPVGLLNVDGFYNSLLSFIDKAVDEGFISPTARRIIVSAPTATQLVRQLEVYTKWSSSGFACLACTSFEKWRAFWGNLLVLVSSDVSKSPFLGYTSFEKRRAFWGYPFGIVSALMSQSLPFV